MCFQCIVGVVIQVNRLKAFIISHAVFIFYYHFLWLWLVASATIKRHKARYGKQGERLHFSEPPILVALMEVRLLFEDSRESGKSFNMEPLQSVPPHSVPSTIRPPTKRPPTKSPLDKASPLQSVPATKRPLLQSVPCYKASPEQSVPGTKGPQLFFNS